MQSFRGSVSDAGCIALNIAATKDGRLYLVCGGVNKVAVVSMH